MNSSQKQEPIPLKVVVVGDGAVGKSCLIITHCSNAFPQDYCPTCFDNYSMNETLGDINLHVSYWDTAGQEDYDRLRPLSYPSTSVFILCFSVINPSSLNNVSYKWVPELRHHCPNTPIVLVGTKKELRNDSATIQNLKAKNINPVTTEEGKNIALQCGATYCECSALTGEGMNETFKHAFTVALHRLNNSSSNKKKGGLFSFPSITKEKELLIPPIPPVLPASEKAPYLYVDTSIFADNLKKMIENDFASDVEFHVENKIIPAHKIILASASDLMRKIFIEQVDQDDGKFIHHSINKGEIAGFTSIHTDEQNKRTQITVANTISYTVFIRVLEFMYTGTATIKDKKDNIPEIQTAAKLFGLEDLITYAQNIVEDNDFLNPSIGTWLNDKLGQTCKELFFNKPLLSDCVFNVNGTKIYGHKAIVCSNCEVIHSILSSGFAESKSDEIDVEFDGPIETFLAFLEYLYTDHSPIEENDSIGILVLSNQYGMKRLITLCELYITKHIEKATSENVEKADVDVIGLLLLSQSHNALQLEKFCLHFVSANYHPMKKRKEFSLLNGDNLKYIEEHQYPPKSYFDSLNKYEKELASYQKKTGDTSEKCNIM